MTNTSQPPSLIVKTKRKYTKGQLHGRIKEPEYESWHSMKFRCANPKSKDYPHYGGRGITYDPAWESFMAFFNDMGPRPSREYTLERRNTNGHYCKENCFWMLKIHQTRNQTTTKLDMQKAREIRQKYASGVYTQKQLAHLYGVVESAIWCVVTNKKWKEL